MTDSVAWNIIPFGGRSARQAELEDGYSDGGLDADIIGGLQQNCRFVHMLVTNPLMEKIAGPCARCEKYYVKKRASQKVYCSRTCGNAATAAIRTREVFVEKREDKLRRAISAARKWVRAKTDLDWKSWVEQQEPDITARFLTRAVNQGELKEPTKG